MDHDIRRLLHVILLTSHLGILFSKTHPPPSPAIIWPEAGLLEPLSPHLKIVDLNVFLPWDRTAAASMVEKPLASSLRAAVAGFSFPLLCVRLLSTVCAHDQSSVLGARVQE